MRQLVLAVATLSLAACGTGAVEYEGDVALSEGSDELIILGTARRAAMLAFLNDCTVTAPVLDGIPYVTTAAATNLVAHRNGADGICGNRGGDRFDTTTEVDEVPQVGQATIERIADFALANGWPKTATAPTAYVLDPAHLAAIADGAVMAFQDDEGIAGDLAAMTPVTGPELDAVVLGIETRIRAGVATMAGRSFASEALAVEAAYPEVVQPLKAQIRSEGVPFLATLITPPSDARLIELARAAMPAHVRDVAIPSPEWQGNLGCLTYEACEQYGLSADIASFGDSVDRYPAQNQLFVTGRIIGLYSEGQFDAVGGLLRMYVEID